MLTRCPVCDTHFRVTSLQIKSRAGRVRCGACGSVFNALETLVDDSRVTPLPAEGVAPNADESSLWFEETGIDLDLTAPAVPAGKADAGRTVADDEIADLHELDMVAALVKAKFGRDAGSSGSVVAPGGYGAETGAGAGALQGTSVPADYLAVSAAPAARPPARGWPWVAGSAFAALLLLLQAVYYYRVELGALRPEWRPALQAACKPFNCTVPRPRHIDELGIETSDLRPDPQSPGHLTLKATLRSQAGTPQEWPLLELTLTDVADRKVAVRHFTASEYLPQDPAINRTLAAGFPPRGEIPVTLALDVGDLPAAGYRLYIFYP